MIAEHPARACGEYRFPTMQLIQTGKYSSVHYDPEHDTFIKTFSPNLTDRWRYRLGIRRYPGYNFRYVAKRLSLLGIQAPDIIESKRYRLVTANVNGVPLKQVIQDDPALQQRYVDILVALYRDRIHCRGLHTDNFLVKDGDIIAIDLDAYKAPRVFTYPRQEFIDCLSRSLKGDEAFLFQRFLQAIDAPAP